MILRKLGGDQTGLLRLAEQKPGEQRTSIRKQVEMNIVKKMMQQGKTFEEIKQSLTAQAHGSGRGGHRQSLVPKDEFDDKLRELLA